jgi:hypothetical protein
MHSFPYLMGMRWVGYTETDGAQCVHHEGVWGGGRGQGAPIKVGSPLRERGTTIFWGDPLGGPPLWREPSLQDVQQEDFRAWRKSNRENRKERVYFPLRGQDPHIGDFRAGQKRSRIDPDKSSAATPQTRRNDPRCYTRPNDVEEPCKCSALRQGEGG